MTGYRYLFGPVPSRRFGRSLGVDLVPMKTCTLNCVFCQLGATPATGWQRAETVPLDAVLEELERWLSVDGRADVITLSGSGEPTLHTGFGEVLAFIGRRSSIPSLLLTNGTLLYDPDVRAAACRADTVKMSLSAWDQASFERVNRPCAGYRFDMLVDGEKAFRRAYGGRLWLEVFLLNGINSAPDDVRRIAALAAEIAPDRVQLNTVARPPAEDFAVAVEAGRLEELALLFDPPAEVIGGYRADTPAAADADADGILAMIRRRPVTAAQIAALTGLHRNDIGKRLAILLAQNSIREDRRGGEAYFVARKDRNDTEPPSP